MSGVRSFRTAAPCWSPHCACLAAALAWPENPFACRGVGGGAERGDWIWVWSLLFLTLGLPTPHVLATSRVLEEVAMSLLCHIFGHTLVSGMAFVICGDGARVQRTQP